MSTAVTWQTQSTSSEATEQLGAQIGRRLRGGETIELVSDLGGGKTTFVRGLAAGFGSHDKVSSPSFTLSNVYKADQKTLYHFDFYRLSDPGFMSYELAEVLGQPATVVVVEWPKIVQSVLPPNRVTITLKPKDPTTREIKVNYPPNYSYLVEGLA